MQEGQIESRLLKYMNTQYEITWDGTAIIATMHKPKTSGWLHLCKPVQVVRGNFWFTKSECASELIQLKCEPGSRKRVVAPKLETGFWIQRGLPKHEVNLRIHWF